MTRETKIGLLVGLAFIIVIGILLSDHLTSSTEPPPAPLAGAGSSVRSGVTTPAGQGNPPITPVVAPPQVSPQQPVLTRNELSQGNSPVQIDVGGPKNQANAHGEPPVQVADGSQNPNVEAALPPAQPEQAVTTNGDTNSALRNTAHQQGEEIVALGQPNSQVNAGATAQKPMSAQPGANKYVAVEGDTVSKMAAKFFGSNTKANRDAIVAANSSLKSDPNRVIVGHSYVIPTSSGGVVASVTTSNPPAPQQPSVPSSENWYTAKPGDSLWRIASEQCGGPGAVPAIQELNKDKLKGENHDIVIEGMKLRLPSKAQVASN